MISVLMWMIIKSVNCLEILDVKQVSSVTLTTLFFPGVCSHNEVPHLVAAVVHQRQVSSVWGHSPCVVIYQGSQDTVLELLWTWPEIKRPRGLLQLLLRRPAGNSHMSCSRYGRNNNFSFQEWQTSREEFLHFGLQCKRWHCASIKYKLEVLLLWNDIFFLWLCFQRVVKSVFIKWET